MASFEMFDSSKAFNTAKLQGYYAGSLAGHAYYNGGTKGFEEILNQAGDYVLQDEDGNVFVKKLGADSMKTYAYYSQNSNSVFDYGSNYDKTSSNDVTLSTNMNPYDIQKLFND